ncbi:MAG: flagellar export protein FliJ [Myxococcota bacterium]
MPKYRLQTLLELRERAKKEAEEAFAYAMQRLNEEKERLRQEQETLERMVEDRHRRREEYARKLASGEMKVTDQSAAYRYIDRLKEREVEQQTVIDAQQEQVREAEKEVQRAQEALVAATQDLKALEKHKENWEAEVRRERMLREEGVMDEIGQAIFQQQLKDRGE